MSGLAAIKHFACCVLMAVLDWTTVFCIGDLTAWFVHCWLGLVMAAGTLRFPCFFGVCVVCFSESCIQYNYTSPLQHDLINLMVRLQMTDLPPYYRDDSVLQTRHGILLVQLSSLLKQETVPRLAVLQEEYHQLSFNFEI